MSALGEMAGGVAHEINNPLAIIALSCKTLKKLSKKDVIDLERLEENISSIEATTMRIAKIVKGLRTFSRNGQENELVETCMKQILDDTLTLCQEKFKHQEIDLILNLNHENDKFECNPVSLSQVLLNLLNNSCDAIEKREKKWIKLEAQVRDQEFKISITDCGEGIAPEIVQKMMQPFFTTKDIGKGTGLGLSISKGIMESHGGHLTYDQTCTNTRFIVTLPLKQKALVAS
jgi:C4-dicarboxylate-specific signal transduction histidine kinase